MFASVVPRQKSDEDRHLLRKKDIAHGVAFANKRIVKKRKPRNPQVPLFRDETFCSTVHRHRLSEELAGSGCKSKNICVQKQKIVPPT